MGVTVHGPEPTTLEGCHGYRYWVQDPHPIFGNTRVDARLGEYPVAVFQPHERSSAQTPIVIGLQGMGAPYQWNGFLVPTLLGMGIACVLFDTPLAGERSLIRNYRGHIVSEMLPLVKEGVSVEVRFVPRLMDTVAHNFNTVLTLIRERHGLQNDRIALFGVSLGTLFASYAFLRDGIGNRLLGTIGHADLNLFARSYTPFFTPLLLSLPGRFLRKFATLFGCHVAVAGIDFLVLLRELCRGGHHCIAANPMAFVERMSPDRRVRFLVGSDDQLVNPGHAVACAKRFPDGECYIVPGLAHGTSRFGPNFVDHVRTFVETQLGDWKK